MDMWKYFAITHKDHTVMNPMSLAKTKEMVDLLRLAEGDHILDVACGKAEFLCLLAERYAVLGTGVDASPYTIAEARAKVGTRGLSQRIELLHMDGAAYEPTEPPIFTMTSCIGGSWIYEGHKGALEALAKMTKPGGLVLVGEPYWKQDPTHEYVKMVGLEREQHGTHESNVKTGVELGLAFLYAAVSNEDDWDRYEGLQWQAAERYAELHPADLDTKELLDKVHTSRDAYLRWGRDCLGWAMYLFRKP